MDMNSVETVFKRGDVFWFEKTFVVEEPSRNANEKIRLRADSIVTPAIVVSNNRINEKSQKIDVVWLTKNPKRMSESNVLIESLKEPSTAVCGFVHTIEKSRATFWIGECTKDEMQRVDKAIAIGLGISPGMLEETQGMVKIEPDDDASDSEMMQEMTDLIKQIAQLKAENAELQRDKEMYRKIIEKNL